MGRPKLLLPWGRTSILGHLVGVWRQLAAAQLAVVLAADDRQIPAELDRLHLPESDRILNFAAGEGMFSSIQCAARWGGWSASLTHWTLVLGDQPQVSLEILRRLCAFAVAHSETICQPSYRNRPRHPAILPRAAFRQLAVAQARTLKEFLRQQGKVELCEIEDAALDCDLDTLADYERALRIWSGH
jgi:molybdenum cofactor cytidylyltransferase